MKISAKLNTSEINGKIKKSKRLASLQMAQRVLKDSNYFCKEKTGNLIRSGTVVNSGEEVVWREKYARRQYNLLMANKDKNPNALYKWFERAKSLHRKEWVSIAQGRFTR
jgi:hypothetical protein